MHEGQFDDSMAIQHQKNPSTAKASNNSRRVGVSARKLAATLWELQEISLSSSALPSKVTNDSSDPHPPDTPNGKRNTQPLPFAPSPASGHLSMRALRRSTVKCRFADAAKRKSAITGLNASGTHMQVLKLLESARPIDCCEEEEEEDTQEIEVDDGSTTTIPSFFNDRLVPSSKSASTTSTELLKVLNRVWSLEEQHKSSLSVVDSLQADLDGARSQVKDLTIQQMSHNRDMESLSKRLADERLEWQEKEQERTMKTLQDIKEELEDEKKSRHKFDLIHRKVTKELADVKKSLMKALKDLEREQKARELMEDVCDELAREVGEDKARVEELQRESIKVREEVEEERKMLQVAEVWREERVQMKLAEARLEIEEKNTALDKLRAELDAFLKAKRALNASQVAHSMKANLKPELPKTQAVSNEQQSSTTLVNLLKEAYEVNDEYQTSQKPLVGVEITCTIQKPSLGIEISGAISNTQDDDEEDEEEDDDHSFIELDKGSYVRGVEVMQPERVNNGNSRDSVDQSHLPIVGSVMNQTARQGLRNASASRAEAMRTTGENKDKVKMWNFELDTPWGADAIASEKVDERVSSEGTSMYEPKSNMKGERYFSLAEEEKEARVYEPKSNMLEERYFSLAQNDAPLHSSTEKGPQASSESISKSEGNIKPCERSSSNGEAVSKGVWSLQNLGGSGRDLKGACALSSATHQSESPPQNWERANMSRTTHQSESPPQNWERANMSRTTHQSESPPQNWECANMFSSSPGPEVLQDNLSSRPTKASVVGGTKPSKDKIVKGKLAEGKSETRLPRFRIGRS